MPSFPTGFGVRWTHHFCRHVDYESLDAGLGYMNGLDGRNIRCAADAPDVELEASLDAHTVTSPVLMHGDGEATVGEDGGDLERRDDLRVVRHAMTPQPR